MHTYNMTQCRPTQLARLICSDIKWYEWYHNTLTVMRMAGAGVNLFTFTKDNTLIMWPSRAATNTNLQSNSLQCWTKPAPLSTYVTSPAKYWRETQVSSHLGIGHWAYTWSLQQGINRCILCHVVWWYSVMIHFYPKVNHPLKCSGSY